MRTAIITISDAGRPTASVVQHETQGEYIGRTDVERRWPDFDAFVFIGALGICVRTIAPCISDKHSDPAVVCIDSTGRHVIAVLSGHVGGANELAGRIAAALGVEPVVTTQSDNQGLWALDTFEKRFGWAMVCDGTLNDRIFTFVGRKPTALLLEARDEGTDYLERTLPVHVTVVKSTDEVEAGRFELLIVVSPFALKETNVPIVQFVPRMHTIGFGLAHHPDNYLQIYDQICQAFARLGLLVNARQWCTVDVKAGEPFIEVVRQHGETVRFFTADELAVVDVPTPSDVVARHVGTPSVSEAAAILGSNRGRLVVRKIKGKNWTAALAIDRKYLSSKGETGHIEIVGAGPGDPDLVSVRGRRLLEQADLILYAGSLVPKALTKCHKSGAVVRSSADMDLDEQCQLMKEHYDKGHFIVRLHTGDPCIFGAIQEQMAFFDREGMSYHITPGISSFLAAAAELRSQFTIPERTQTIILTRGEGRTPMPDREKLHLLARSRSTMCIFLSAAIVDDVQRELLQEYPEDTPVAACYHLTWPDQRIYRGQLKNLARIVHDNNLTLTTMLVVGEAIDNRHGLSELYNKHFTHLFRKGESI